MKKLLNAAFVLHCHPKFSSNPTHLLHVLHCCLALLGINTLAGNALFWRQHALPEVTKAPKH